MNWPFSASDVPGPKLQVILSVDLPVPIATHSPGCAELMPPVRGRRPSLPRHITPHTGATDGGEGINERDGWVKGVSKQLSELAEARDCPACLIASSLAQQLAGEDLAPFLPRRRRRMKESEGKNDAMSFTCLPAVENGQAGR